MNAKEYIKFNKVNTWLNKVKPPADATIFRRKFFERARKKSGGNTPRRIDYTYLKGGFVGMEWIFGIASVVTLLYFITCCVTE